MSAPQVGDRLAAALAAAGVPRDEVAEVGELTGGTFNSVVRVATSDGAHLVVKLAPDAGVPVLRHERNLLATEALFYRLAREATEVPLPEPLTPASDSGHLVMSHCPGTNWAESKLEIGAREHAVLRAELGRHVAALHTIKGEGFGYPSRALGPLDDSWRAAFLRMVDAVLSDAARFGVALPRPPAEILALFAAQGALLDEVTVPHLVHVDLWDGNVLVDGDRIGALIDAERAFWGDPLADFVSLALLSDIERDEDFLAAYRAAGGPAVVDAAGRRRIALYQAYLYLIMWVEAVPRQYGAERLDLLRRKVVAPLTALLDDLDGLDGR
ncbi:phosphotransferase [Streptomyces longispororuber]|uniref:phosphotransferase n=1 Tax=Streptomyces longispororuber TaxID=68230 RepID=UPI00210D743F|nr:aminoglycoside phosphotransferase family protein [Streptomyces longispororuber]MCQ4209055.1 aminoglycoside phosphotransferase family protein [Streptomyces longispororuber]